MTIDLADQVCQPRRGVIAPTIYVIPSGLGLLHILIYDLPICFDTVSEKTNRQHDAFGIELRTVSQSMMLCSPATEILRESR